MFLSELNFFGGLFDSFSVAGLYDKCVGKLCLDFFQIGSSGIDRRIRTVSVFYRTAIAIRLHILEALESFVTLLYDSWSGQKLYLYTMADASAGLQLGLVSSELHSGSGSGVETGLTARLWAGYFLDVTPEAFR